MRLGLPFAVAVAALLARDDVRAQSTKKWWDVQPRPAYRTLEKVGTFFDWFEVYALPDGTLAIYEPYQFEETICYLVRGDTRAVLIDTGLGIGNVKEVVARLTSLPVSVIVTHEHFDHFGGAYRFDDVAVANEPGAVARLAAGVDAATLRPQVEGDHVWKPLPRGFEPRTWLTPPVSAKTLLDDGAVIDLGTRKLEVIRTPGHTPGSLCLLDRGRRVLFTGDHFYPGPLYLHSRDANVSDFVASNKKLASLAALYDHVLGGHNEPWAPGAVIPRVTEALATILAGGGTFEEERGVRRYAFSGFDVLIRPPAGK